MVMVGGVEVRGLFSLQQVGEGGIVSGEVRGLFNLQHVGEGGMVSG